MTNSNQNKEANNQSSSFEENFKKLEVLLTDLQNNRVSIDQLIGRLKDALGAMRICKDILKETKAQLIELNNEFKQISSEAEDEEQ